MRKARARTSGAFAKGLFWPPRYLYDAKTPGAVDYAYRGAGRPRTWNGAHILDRQLFHGIRSGRHRTFQLTTDINTASIPPGRLKGGWIAHYWLPALVILLLALVGGIGLLSQRDDPVQVKWSAARNQIATTERRFLAMRTDIPVASIMPDGQRAFSLSNVVRVVQDYRRGVLEAVPAELIGLRDYIDDYFTNATQTLSRSEFRSILPPCDGCVSQSVVESVYRLLSDRTRALSQIDRIAVDLTTNSEPPDARAEILYRSDALYRSNTTNGTLRNVYRGKYRARMSLADHKTGTYDDVNLIDDPRTTLVCTLPPGTAASTATCRMTE